MKATEAERQQLLTELKNRSTNGIAPNTKDDEKFYGRAKYVFGSWINFCELAGVKPLNPWRCKDRPSAKYKGEKVKTDDSARFAYALGKLIETGETVTDECIATAMLLVREGAFDRLEIR